MALMFLNQIISETSAFLPNKGGRGPWGRSTLYIDGIAHTRGKLTSDDGTPSGLVSVGPTIWEVI
jgi:hypothetical protein